MFVKIVVVRADPVVVLCGFGSLEEVFESRFCIRDILARPRLCFAGNHDRSEVFAAVGCPRHIDVINDHLRPTEPRHMVNYQFVVVVSVEISSVCRGEVTYDEVDGSFVAVVWVLVYRFWVFAWDFNRDFPFRKAAGPTQFRFGNIEIFAIALDIRLDSGGIVECRLRFSAIWSVNVDFQFVSDHCRPEVFH